MSEGLIDGLKKIFTGKDLLAKHMFLFVMYLIGTLPTAIATAKVGSNNTPALYHYMYIEQPVLGLIAIAVFYIIGIYIINFMHNSIKYFIWKHSQTDENKINALEIMPSINGKLFKPFWKWFGLTILWPLYAILYFVLVFLLGVLIAYSSNSTTAVYICIPVMATLILIMCVSMPFIFLNFAKNYKFSGNAAPWLIFTYLPKIFVPSFILVLKYLGFIILYVLVYTALILALSFIIALFGIASGSLEVITEAITSIPVMTLLSAVMLYTGNLLAMAFYHAAACIYYEYIECTQENDVVENQL